MPVLAFEQLLELATALFRAAGASIADAATVGHHLVEANLSGHDSHGVLRLPQYLKAIHAGELQVAGSATLVSETGSTAVVDGGRGFGQTVGKLAMRLAIRKAQSNGVAAVTARNSYHTGRIATYPLMAAAEGLLGIVMVNAGGGGQSVAPFGGLGRRLATNPISIAAPSGHEFPILLDIATSVAPEGKVRDCLLRDQPVPTGWLVDSKGNPSTDPKDFYASPGGALLPLGASAGYKGFGLAFMIDILAGALSGAGCCRPEVTEARDGCLMIAIDIARFLPLENFHQHVALLVNHVKSSPIAPGFSEVLVPGEMEYRQRRRRQKEGIAVDTTTWQEIESWCAKLGVPAVAPRSVPSAHQSSGTLSQAV